MALQGEQQWFGRHGGDQLQGDQGLAPGLPHQLSCLVAIENDSIDRLIGRPCFGADGDSIDLRARTKLRRTACKGLIGCCASACQPGKGCGLIGMRAKSSAEQTAGVDVAVGD